MTLTIPVKFTSRAEKRFPAPFDSFLSPHPKLTAAARRLAQIACNPTGQDIVFLVGPSGVGKKALIKYVQIILGDSFSEEMKNNPRMVPAIPVVLRSVPSRGFSWDVFYRGGLRAAAADLHLKKHLPPWRIAETGGDRYGTAYLDMLKAVDARLVMADEGAELAKVGSERMLFRNVDQLKILTEASGVVHCLVGEYRILGLANFNGQHARRTEVIHFSRYSDSPADVLLFCKTVGRFTAVMGKHIEVQLDPCIDFIRERSVGCVGTVRNWFHKAYIMAMASGQILDCDVIKKTAPSEQQSAIWRDEALLGEAQYARIAGSGGDATSAILLVEAATGRTPKHLPLEMSVRALASVNDRSMKEEKHGKK